MCSTCNEAQHTFTAPSMTTTVAAGAGWGLAPQPEPAMITAAKADAKVEVSFGFFEVALLIAALLLLFWAGPTKGVRKRG